jgi:hypothetical protein
MALTAQAWIAIILSLGGGALMLYWVRWAIKLLRSPEYSLPQEPQADPAPEVAVSAQIYRTIRS